MSAPASDAVVTKPKLAPAAMAGGMRIQQRRPARTAGGAGRPAAGAVPGGADATNFAHYPDEGQGFQLSPAVVLTAALVFIGIVIMLHVLGKLAK